MIAGIQIGRHRQHVVSGLEGVYCRTPNVSCIEAGQARHVETIGNNDPLETQFVLEQSP